MGSMCWHRDFLQLTFHLSPVLGVWIMLVLTINDLAMNFMRFTCIFLFLFSSSVATVPLFFAG